MGCKQYEYPLLHHSSECMDDGVGCDGFCETHQDECNCKCHSEYAPEFITQEDVRKWHED